MTDNAQQIGLTSGPFGRSLRLLIGIFLILFLASDLFASDHSHSMLSIWLLLLSFLGILAGFIGLYYLLNLTKSVNNPLLMTLFFVVPTMYLIIAPEINSAHQIGHWLNYPELNHPFQLALLAYLAVSFLLQWYDKYGGCEVIAIPNYLFKRSSASYCIPLLPVDLLEKAIRKPHKSETED